jgi:DeoR/GlpR family transcriptional regulator of sugar metabolism
MDPGLRHEGGVERRAWILSALRDVAFVSITDLARRLQVSQMTIRRDLHSLEGSGDVRLFHGGASLTPRALHSAAYGDDEHSVPRDVVGRQAADLIGSTDTVAIDAGATAYAVVRSLPRDFAGCVITHSMPVLQFLSDRPELRVVALGGEFLGDRRAYVGPTTEAAVRQMRVRTFFFSPQAVDARGTYARSPAEASVQRALMDIADQIVLVSTSEAFSSCAPARVADLDRLRFLVADHLPPVDVVDALERAGVVPHIAER